MFLLFTGDHCSHCDTMKLLLSRLHYEHGIHIVEKNITQEKENEKLYTQYQTPDCDGLPLLVRTNDGNTLCGEVSYQKLVQFTKDK